MGKGVQLSTCLPVHWQRCYLEQVHSVAPCRELGLTGGIGVDTRPHRWEREGVQGTWQTLRRHSGSSRGRLHDHDPFWPQRLGPLPGGRTVASGSEVAAIEGGRGWSGVPRPHL